MPSVTTRSRWTPAVLVLLLAGAFPVAVSLAAHRLIGDRQIYIELPHEAIELAGAFIALAVSLLLVLRLGHEGRSPHLIWVVSALTAMGLVDGAHAVSRFGLSWSWLRHGATLAGGLFFALIWLPHAEVFARRKRILVPLVGGLALALSLAVPRWISLLPAPWGPEGYSLAVKIVNAAGGLGFLAGAGFFLRRYVRRPRGEELVYASQALLFGGASLFFGFSHLWAADWWVWHIGRFLAYSIVFVAAFRNVREIYRETASTAARLANINAALQAEIEDRHRAEETSLTLRREIEARRQAEESQRALTTELADLTASLEKRVEERTADLAAANARLLAESAERARLAAAADQAEEGIAVTDPGGRILYANPALEKTTGRKDADLRSVDYADLLEGAEEDEAARRRLRDVVRSGEAWRGRVRRRIGDGPALDLEISLSPIRDAAGEVSGCLALERDVTRELQLQQHLLQMQKVEALGTLAGGIAHDLNNLLSPIALNAELALLDVPPASRLRPELTTILQAAERGKELVKQIVAFSRQRERERRILKVAPLLEESLKFLRSSLPRTIDIRKTIEPGVGCVLADPTGISQIVINLCSNAAYAMRERGGILRVGLAETEIEAASAEGQPDLKPGRYVELTVEDTGVGMTREVMERAFDPFFTTKKPGEGTGMGLAVVRSIVGDSGGAVIVRSEPGRGSSFRVLLPRQEAEAADSKAAPAPPAAGRGFVLFVDDEPAQVATVRSVLERLGYRVTAETDSRRALSLFRVDPDAYDAVVTDLTMPGLTGVELAEEMLRIRPGLPIVLCTGYSERVDAKTAKERGISRFLMKPFSMGELGETVRQALAEVGPSEGGTAGEPPAKPSG